MLICHPTPRFGAILREWREHVKGTRGCRHPPGIKARATCSFGESDTQTFFLSSPPLSFPFQKRGSMLSQIVVHLCFFFFLLCDCEVSNVCLLEMCGFEGYIGQIRRCQCYTIISLVVCEEHNLLYIVRPQNILIYNSSRALLASF